MSSRRSIQSIRMTNGQVNPCCGLANFGNTCYMNAALQCLFTCTQFTNALNSPLPMTDSPLWNAIGELLHKMTSGGAHADARKLKEALGATVERFSSFSQQDSQEFLTVLLECLHTELMATSQEAVITECFQGEQECVLTCQTCAKSVERKDPFTFIFVPIHESPVKLNMNDSYEKMENFEDGNWFCPGCQTKTNVTRLMKLQKVPPILMIYLKRFCHKNGTEYKLDTFVEFPDKLQVTNFDQLYNLIAVINHHGTISGGHYVAFCKRGDSWYCFNDLSVTSCQERDIVTKDAYVLFYERQKVTHSDAHDSHQLCSCKERRDENSYQSKGSSGVENESDRSLSSVNKMDKNETSGYSPIGFRNYSNNNHLNAVLQCLKATQPFGMILQHTTELSTRGESKCVRALRDIFNSTDEDILKSSIESLTVLDGDDPKTFLISVLNDLTQVTKISGTIGFFSMPIEDKNTLVTKCDILQESHGNIQSQIVVVLLHKDQCCQSTAKFPIISTAVSDGPPFYSLYGVVFRSGQYYAWCKINEQWYQFNDDTVTQITCMNEPSVVHMDVSDEVCVLFYQKDI